MDQSNEMPFFFDIFDSEEDNSSQRDRFRLKEGERREVCILFADVKNSTELSNRLDPEAFQSRMDTIMKIFTKCITHYGGYVDKYMGDGIMALFGAKRASEQDTERAVLAGLKMIDQLKAFNLRQGSEPASPSLDIRIGINTGLVIVGKVGEAREGDFTVTGAPVNLAQRMESGAPTGKILMSHATMKTVERFFDFQLFDKLKFKGFAEEIDCYTVLGQKMEKGQRWYRQKSRYVGRTKELNTLDSIVQSLNAKAEDDKDGSIVPVVGIRGDAGMGKTRLTHEFFQHHNQAVSLIIGTASGVVQTPFQLITSILEREFKLNPNHSPSEKLDLINRGFASLMEGLSKAKMDDLQDAKPLVAALLEVYIPDPRLKLKSEELLLHLRMALVKVIIRLLQVQHQKGLPVILILDDLHWIDESSASILEHIVDALLLGSESSLLGHTMLILLYRQNYQLSPVILNSPHFTELDLQALTPEEMKQMIISNTDGISLPEETLQKVQELSNGNPFYLEEWCNYLADISPSATDDLPVPANLNALILSRLDLLEKSIRLLLQKASVIGQEFLVEILNWMEERLYDPINVSDTLNQLEQQSFVLKLLGFDYSAYFFKHITTRDVAYKTLLLENRIILHKLTAEAIESLYPERQSEFTYALADHYHKAGTRDKAVFYLYKAALSAKELYNNRLAIDLFHKLLTWLSSSSELGEEPTQSRVHLHLAEIYALIGKWDEALAELELASSSAKSADDWFEYHRQHGILAFRKGDFVLSLRDWEKALELAHNSEVKLAIIHGNLGVWYQHHKQFDEAMQHHLLSLRGFRAAGEDLRYAKTLSNIGLMKLNMGEFDEASNYLAEGYEIARTNQFLQLSSIVLGNIGLLHQKKQEYEQARASYDLKLELVQKIDDKAELIKVLGNLGNLFRDKGDSRKAIEYYSQVLLLKQRLGNSHEIGITLGVLAAEYYRLEDFAQALSYAHKALDMGVMNPKNIETYQDIISNSQAKLKGGVKE